MIHSIFFIALVLIAANTAFRVPFSLTFRGELSTSFLDELNQVRSSLNMDIPNLKWYPLLEYVAR